MAVNIWRRMMKKKQTDTNHTLRVLAASLLESAKLRASDSTVFPDCQCGGSLVPSSTYNGKQVPQDDDNMRGKAHDF
jgi:hypothetical protein